VSPSGWTTTPGAAAVDLTEGRGRGKNAPHRPAARASCGHRGLGFRGAPSRALGGVPADGRLAGRALDLLPGEIYLRGRLLDRLRCGSRPLCRRCCFAYVLIKTRGQRQVSLFVFPSGGGSLDVYTTTP